MLRKQHSIAWIHPLESAGARPSGTAVRPLLGTCPRAAIEASRRGRSQAVHARDKSRAIALAFAMIAGLLIGSIVAMPLQRGFARNSARAARIASPVGAATTTPPDTTMRGVDVRADGWK